MPIRKNTIKPAPRSILVTGASSGIGAALAEFYAGPGVTLFLSGRNMDRLEQILSLCRARGATAHGQVIDVRDPAAMADWITACDILAPLDLVIANAGISGGTGAGVEDAAQVREIFAINIDGVVNTVQPAIDLMRARRGGQIAIMASLAGLNGWPGAPAYSASKAAVRVYGDALRGALMDDGVGVSVICPGFVVSRMTDVNHFPMPFLMPADRAAAIIASGLARNAACIAFPWQTHALTGFIAAIPSGLRSIILKNMPRKSGI